MKQILSLAFACMLFSLSAICQKNYWQQVQPGNAASFTNGKELFPDDFKPSAYTLFSLNENNFKQSILQAPLQAKTAVSKSQYIISLPAGDGTIQDFKIAELPVMSPKLQAKYPEIKTYKGQCIQDPSSLVCFDFSPQGFHAMIISPKKSTVYINPVHTAENLYVVFNRTAVSSQNEVFSCKMDKVLNSDIQGTEKPFSKSDGNIRTYRFAVACGAEFSKLFLNGNETTVAQKKAKVMAGLVTDLARTNFIFETDFGIHLNYVDKEDTLIFLDPDTDPFLSNASGYNSLQWNKEAEITIDSLIGSANYDIGHLLMGYNTGGYANCIGCVCNNKNKGSAVTGYKNHLTDDPFIVDFWDHEIGHQFGASHTFDYNSETGSISQMEPGSGSTIMGYAGYTGSYYVQQHSDPYFHAVSIQQIDDYITTGKGNSCAVLSSEDNSVPVAKASSDYIIPKSTPFILTGKATDDDDFDVLTYCWEQYDVYRNNGTSNAIPKSTSSTGPIFRSFNPTLGTQRVFPEINSILDGTNKNKWEVLPSVARTLNFRLTVRDNHADGGATGSDNMAVKVDGNSGPFKVTQPNTNISVGSGALQTVKWDVANSDKPPVSCSRVNIFLSIDGGITFPYLLIANTPNDGSQQITYPSFPTQVKTARIKIVASDNIFFDISDSDFDIIALLPVTWLSFTAQNSGANDALLKWSTANEINNDHFEIERSSNALNFTKIGSIAVKSGNSSTVQDYTYTDVNISSATNYYRIKQVDKDGKLSYSITAKLSGHGNILSWNLQPNPATDHTKIVFNENLSGVKIFITDASGKGIYKNSFESINSGYELTVPINHLAKGVYIVHVNTGNKTRTEKLIKN